MKKTIFFTLWARRGWSEAERSYIGINRDKPWRTPLSPEYDFFDWATMVYQLMCEQNPPAGVTSVQEMQDMLEKGNFPELEDEYLGRFVRRCWREEYKDADTLKRNLLAFVRERGFEVVGELEDEVQGKDHVEIFKSLIENCAGWDKSTSE